MHSTTAPLADLAAPYALEARQRAAFAMDGCIHLPSVLAPQTVAGYGAEITRLVTAHSASVPPIAERSTYGKAFLQVINLWRESELAREFVFSPRLAHIAAELLGCSGVRLYHDQALDKEPGGGFTPWHVDQQYWPLATDRCVTAWIPLQDIPTDLGPLELAPGSQHLLAGRELEIGDESERRLGTTLRDFPVRCEPFALGDVSFHLGWTFHRAGPNRSERYRRVMTIIYIDVDMRLAEPANAAQRGDRAAFCPGVEVGEVIASPLNPVLWRT